ncbi:MAG: hypothetical protein MI892_24355 [Desulfobacterales bacterium]|nr:hypothetical protein [Desulfobacterales bacterium]
MDKRSVKQIHIHQQVHRQMTVLAKRNNATAIVSVRAKKVIEKLRQGVPLLSSGLFRPKTDRRFKDSIKFDLGKGFRLICIRQKDAIHVMFLGDHDSCDTWLTHHGRTKPHKKIREVVVLNSYSHVPEVLTKDDSECLDDEISSTKISQKDLRQVFKGLIG